MKDTNTIKTQQTGTAANETCAVPPKINTPDPEAEGLRAENIELKSSIRQRDARERIGQLLAAADARSPELLFTSVKDDLQFSGDGELQNAAALVERLKKTFPEQFGRPVPTGTVDGGAGTAARAPFLSVESLARMTPSQIQKLDWAEVRRVLSDR